MHVKWPVSRTSRARAPPAPSTPIPTWSVDGQLSSSSCRVFPTRNSLPHRKARRAHAGTPEIGKRKRYATATAKNGAGRCHCAWDVMFCKERPGLLRQLLLLQCAPNSPT